jgi:hypothetical protein
MLQPPGRVLTAADEPLLRASRCELGFLIDPIGPGTARSRRSRPERRSRLRAARQRLPARRRPAALGRRRDRDRSVPVPLRGARRPAALLGFRTAWHAEAAALVPNAQRRARADIRDGGAAGGRARRPRLRARADARGRPRARARRSSSLGGAHGLRLRRCYGCAVEIDGELKRLVRRGPGARRPREGAV